MKHNLILNISTALAFAAVSCSPKADKTANVLHNPLMDHEEQITEIIASMTLDEKVEMLHGKHMFSSAGIERLGIADIEYADGPFGIREEMEPHSWNSINLGTDSATFFPTGSALAATWSKELAYAYGKGMATEARLRGKDMILGPAINIQRLPTGGRTYEYLSEDPLLSGELAVGYTQGVQDNDAAVCLKHYALNNQENMRGFVSSNASERVMREIYLAPFEAAVRKANAYGVMAAYNKVDGVWCSENDLLQNKILRDEWGFRGIIISDWGGTHSTVGAAYGGLDVEMPGQTYMGQALIDSVNAGAVSMDVIDAKVRNLLRVRLTIPAVPADKANQVMTSQPEQQQIAYDVASKSVVLLKNEPASDDAGKLLPLDLSKIRTIAVIGDNATKTMAQGGVGAGVKTLYEITPLEGLKNALEGSDVKIIYAQGYASRPQQWGGKPVIDEKAEARKAVQLRKEALDIARNADVVIFVGGDNRIVETEGSDRQNMDLPFGQNALIEDLAKVNPNIVTVMVAGAPLDLRRVEQASPALVYSWFNGSEGGHALADIITGKISPSGRLPFTLPVKLEDSPAYALGVYPQKEEAADDVFVDLVNKDRFKAQRKADADYSEGLLVGYRWFTTKGVATLYPFGHGLTYGEFVYSDLNVSDKGDDITINFTLTNTGKADAEEVAQVYVSRPESNIERPVRELKGFCRVALKAGESRSVSMTISRDELRHWDETLHSWAVEPGKAVFMAGSSSEVLPLEAAVTI
ncbi:MAG: glycoside hydrolase family 3 C-terminal domain-containing protein [Bacteroidales bacterium]|nr:glycoside hydrolase family 3 C-terminal domain-containing protein [Candidatus Liminaster caballi]